MAQADTPIHCVFSIDDGYCQHAAVAIASLTANSGSQPLFVHVVHHHVSEANLARLRDYVCALPNVEAAFHAFDASRYGHFRLDGRITLAAYFRLFLPDILPPDLDRVIYLDSDIVVLGDIAELWRKPLNGALVGAAPDLFPENARLGLPADYSYFNSGVLLIDLEGWRRTDLTRALVDYVEKNHAILKYHDQDALNAVLQTRVCNIGYAWNFQARTRPSDARLVGLSEAEYERISRAPRLVHYTTSSKPWLYWPDIAFEGEYLRYLQSTPWRGYVQPDKTLKSTVRRWIRRRLPAVDRLYRTLGRLRRGRADRPSVATGS